METVGPGGIIGEMARFKVYVHNTPFFSIQVMRIMADRLRRMDQLVADKG